MIITLHDSSTQWKHAQPLRSLVEHMVLVYTDEKVYDGTVLAITNDDCLMLEDDAFDKIYRIPLNTINRIHYP